MNDKKRILNLYSPFEYLDLLSRLQQLSSEGWVVESAGRLMLVCRRHEPGSLQPRIEPNTFSRDIQSKGDAIDYRKRMEKKGWHLSAVSGPLTIWYGKTSLPNQANSIKDELLLCSKSAWHRELCMAGFSLIMLLYGIIFLWRNDYTSYLTNSGLATLMIAPLFVLPSFLIGIYEYLCYYRSRKKLHAGTPLAISKRKHPQQLPQYILLSIEIVYIILLFFSDLFSGYPRYLLLLLPIAIAVVFVTRLKRCRKQLLGKVLSFITLLICGSALWFFSSYSPVKNTIPAGNTSYAVLSSFGEFSARTSLTENKSLAVPEHYVYTEKASNGASVSTEYFRIPNTHVRQAVLHAIHRTVMRNKLSEAVLSADAWKSDMAWQINSSSVLICRGEELYYYTAKDANGANIIITPDQIT